MRRIVHDRLAGHDRRQGARANLVVYPRHAPRDGREVRPDVIDPLAPEALEVRREQSGIAPFGRLLVVTKELLDAMAANHVTHEQAAQAVDPVRAELDDRLPPIVVCERRRERRLVSAPDRLRHAFGEKGDGPARRAQVRVGVIQLVRVGQQRRVDLHRRFLRASAFRCVIARDPDVLGRVPVVGDLAVRHVEHRCDVGPLGLERVEGIVAGESSRQRHQRGIDVETKVQRLAHEHRGRVAAAPDGGEPQNAWQAKPRADPAVRHGREDPCAVPCGK